MIICICIYIYIKNVSNFTYKFIFPWRLGFDSQALLSVFILRPFFDQLAQKTTRDGNENLNKIRKKPNISLHYTYCVRVLCGVIFCQNIADFWLENGVSS